MVGTLLFFVQHNVDIESFRCNVDIRLNHAPCRISLIFCFGRGGEDNCLRVSESYATVCGRFACCPA